MKYQCPICNVVIGHDGKFPDFIKVLLWMCPVCNVHRNFVKVELNVTKEIE